VFELRALFDLEHRENGFETIVKMWRMLENWALGTRLSQTLT